MPYLDKNKKALMYGDYVLVNKPTNVNEPPTWPSEMDKFHSKIYKVVSVYGYSTIILHLFPEHIYDNDYIFNSSWLEKIHLPDMEN